MSAKPAEAVFSLFRRAGVPEEKFSGDAKGVEKDLGTLKKLIES